MKKWAPLVLLLAVGLLFAAACGGGSSTPSNAQFRVVNAVQDSAGGYDVLVDGSTLTTKLTYWTGTSYLGTSYAALADGAHQVEARNTGTSADVVSQPVNLTGGSNYTYVLVGAADLPASILLTDTSTSTDSGKTQVRIVNAAQNFGAMDVYITAVDTNIFDVSANLANLNFGSAGDYQKFDKGSYRIRITKPGEKNIVYFDSGTIDLASGSVQTFVFSGGAALAFQELPDAAGTAS